MFSAPEAAPLEEAYRKIARPADPEYKSLRDRARRLNLKERQKLIPLLEEFYSDRTVKYVNRLIITPIGAEGSRLKCQGAEMAYLATGSSKSKPLKDHQTEIRDFTNYLRQTLQVS
jgi:hypothetical protein